MSTATQTANSDKSSSNYSRVGGQPTNWQTLMDNSTSVYCQSTPEAIGNILVFLSTTPSDFQSPSACSVFAGICFVGKNPPNAFVQVFKSNGTAITAQHSFPATSTFTVNSAAMTISGSPTKADIDGAYLELSDDGSGDGSTIFEWGIEAEVVWTYTPAASFTVPTYDEGPGSKAGAAGLKRFYEGARYLYRESKKLFLPDRRLFIPPHEARRPKVALI